MSDLSSTLYSILEELMLALIELQKEKMKLEETVEENGKRAVTSDLNEQPATLSASNERISKLEAGWGYTSKELETAKKVLTEKEAELSEAKKAAKYANNLLIQKSAEQKAMLNKLQSELTIARQESEPGGGIQQRFTEEGEETAAEAELKVRLEELTEEARKARMRDLQQIQCNARRVHELEQDLSVSKRELISTLDQLSTVRVDYEILQRETCSEGDVTENALREAQSALEDSEEAREDLTTQIHELQKDLQNMQTSPDLSPRDPIPEPVTGFRRMLCCFKSGMYGQMPHHRLAEEEEHPLASISASG